MKKYKILLYGNKTFGSDFSPEPSEDYDVILKGGFPPEDLTLYDFIIVDYSAFQGSISHYEKEIEVFEKRAINAVERGKTVIFLYYDDAPTTGEGASNLELRKYQIGLRFLEGVMGKTIIRRSPFLTHNAELKRMEFKKYFDRWGVGKLTFLLPQEKEEYATKIQTAGDALTAFSVKHHSGQVIFLPCQRNLNAHADTSALFDVLSNALIKYSMGTKTEIPPWAQEPLFPDELKLFEKIKNLTSEIDETKILLAPFEEGKLLAFSREYVLHSNLPKFIEKNLKLSVFENETYVEDFWILDANEKNVICEIKSSTKGFKKTMVYDIYKHREENSLDESFPAVLFVNLNLSATNWKTKMAPIAPQDCKLAKDNNVLIVRVEDLLFMWNSVKATGANSDSILKLLKSSTGWLHFFEDGTHKIEVGSQ